MEQQPDSCIQAIERELAQAEAWEAYKQARVGKAIAEWRPVHHYTELEKRLLEHPGD